MLNYKKLAFILLFLTFKIVEVQSNNILVSNISLENQNATANTIFIQFDISWDNSWRTSTYESNWDAAWVFVKFRRTTSNTWNHVSILSTGHVAPSGSSISAPTDSTGVFIYKDADGIGSNSFSSVQLKWNYANDGLLDNMSIELCVYAIEMVYIPQNSFSVGSGGSEVGSLTNGSWSSGATIPLSISSESAITIENTAGNLWGISSAGSSTIGGTGSLSANYPKGYQGFYCMKYEITQGQYVSFLNKLTRSQQDTHTETSLSSGTTSVTKRYVMTNTTTSQNRNGIRCDASIDGTAPITFYCDLNGNGTENEADDGEFLACNFLSWANFSAYLDWCGLRPMSELEFEKACRGTETPVANEYAWGSTTIASSSYSLSNDGANNEVISSNYSTSNGNASYTSTDGTINGPLRNGIFAASTGNTGRITSGSTYYGILEMSGNLWERVVSLGNATGRTYTGLHGNGALDATGYANVSNWPADDAIGGGFRGGNWNQASSYLCISNRIFGALTGNTREYNYGGRGVRTAP